MMTAKCHADKKDDPPPFVPGLTESGHLYEDIAKISGAVADIREDSQDEDEEYSLEGDDTAAVRPVDDEIGQDDPDQDGVVRDPTGLPIGKSVGNSVAETADRSGWIGLSHRASRA
jgi:hypothetical protein